MNHTIIVSSSFLLVPAMLTPRWRVEMAIRKPGLSVNVVKRLATVQSQAALHARAAFAEEAESSPAGRAHMSRRIDERLGKELGLAGRYADVPAFQIVNDAHELFHVLRARLIDLEYGPSGEQVKRHPLWPDIDAQKL
ncbi:hypothetical protein, partial [Mesorhizobium sp.]|uniref:hypothetical protein n=1 Tax=Mesorhizobium sp. TaxID=1871066 RepID=UPI003459E2D6